MNIIDPILFQGSFQPSTPALLAPGKSHEVITYRHLAQMIHNVRRHGREAGLERGNVVVLLIRDQILHAALILGLTKYGVVTVTPPDGQFSAALHADAVLTDGPYSANGQQRIVAVDRSWIAGDGLPAEELRPIPDEDTAYCRFVLTSGTTGEAKAAAFTHGRMSFRAMRHQTVFGHRYAECSRVLLDTGWATAMAFTTAIYVLSRGGTLVLRGAAPEDTMQALINYQVQALVGSPGILSSIVAMQDRMPHLFPRLDVIISIGSILTPTLSEQVRSRIGTNLISAYGSTEAGVVASAPATAIANIPDAVGYVTPDVEVDIVDADGNKLGPNKEGRLRIRSGAASAGLIDLSHKLIPFDPLGYYPGDIGSLTRDGVLIISGREQALINLGGDKVSPEKIELAMVGLSAVRDAGVFTLRSDLGIEKLAAAVVWNDSIDRQASRQALRRHLEGRFPAPLIPNLFVELDAIPRNPMGKIDRFALKRVASETLAKAQGSAPEIIKSSG